MPDSKNQPKAAAVNELGLESRFKWIAEQDGAALMEGAKKVLLYVQP